MCESMVSVCAWVCRTHHDGKPPTYACDRACICATACHRVCTVRYRSRTEVISISMYKRMMPCTHGYCPCTHGVHARMGTHAAGFRRGDSSAGLDSGEDVSLLGAAGSDSGDAVRLMGCEGSVSLAWRSGEG